MSFDAALLEEALATLGEVLDARGHRFEVVAVGGGGLLLLRVIERPTKDLDLVGVLTPAGLVSAEPLPAELVSARWPSDRRAAPRSDSRADRIRRASRESPNERAHERVAGPSAA